MTRRLDGLTDLLARLAAHHPRPAFRLASLLGAMRNRVTRRWPAASEAAAVLPRGSAAGIAALAERNEVLVRCVRRSGIEPIRPLVSVPDALRDLRGPCILGTFHVGALHAVGVALEAIGRPVLAFRDGLLYTPRPPVEVQTTAGDEQQRAAAFVRALESLRRGELVLLALDVVPGAAIAAECLGRPLALARGAFALARMTGAPIVPLAMRWEGGEVGVVLGAPLIGQDELALAGAAARWLDRYLRQSPSELTLELLRNLLYP
jgi:hypothetical protein